MEIKRIIGYLGAKVNLYDFIEKTILKNNKKRKLFIDLFAGTCAVSKLVKEKSNFDIMTNDLALYSKVLTSELKIHELNQNDFDKFKTLLKKIDQLPLKKGTFFHEFSMGGKPKSITDLSIFEAPVKGVDDKGNEVVENKNYQEYKTSRMFFKGEVGQKIDTVREETKRLFNSGDINEEIKDLILLFLLSYANANANNTSVYGAYLKHDKITAVKPFYNSDLLQYLDKKYTQFKNSSINIESFHDYADKTIENIKNNYLNYSEDEVIIYWDPPYSSRSYEANYHILEYLCDLDFSHNMIKKNSKTGMKNSELKSDNPFTSKARTPGIFKDLIDSSMNISNLMYISYSSEGLMKKNDIKNILKELSIEHGYKLTLKEHTKEYKRFTSGEAGGANTNKKNTVDEIIWEIRR